MTPAPVYDSTRGETGADFEHATLRGLAGDGGLYVPRTWPEAPAELWTAPMTYPMRAAQTLAPFAAGTIDSQALADMAARAYAGFDEAAVTPVSDLDQGLHLLELYHGPTLAFKDLALQLLGRVFDFLLAERGERRIILGATSGDTGAAAIEACRRSAHLSVVMLHPRGRVSAVQRRLMTTVDAPNIHNLAVDGSFDDCQRMVKTLLRQGRLDGDERAFAAINSINLVRVLAQSVYYMSAIAALGGGPVNICVPTGNFGNAFAAYAAAQMGAPVGRIALATNRNDILHRVVSTGRYEPAQAVETLSPAMDIQKASNFERLVYDLKDRDPAATAHAMAGVDDGRGLVLSDTEHARLAERFTSVRVDDAETVETLRQVHSDTGRVIDPHTAVGVAAARRAFADDGVPTLIAATAHPAKFPETVADAIGAHPALPSRLADLMERAERVETLPADAAALARYVKEHV
ncbi:threonine synthase [Rhodothalassium salexigens]|uniref:threonine synthase n=1 Tax=Rhodothalassium salexigens TaxID=1086 RepID=UPI001914858F|nr:threonine synthase [Rhodothalassium salexigens]MBK5912475.1 threonine synthase [Rhodothalassium salexigens]MBK5920646.1 threonine synthase [Rhodothalassium salexigens]